MVFILRVHYHHEDEHDKAERPENETWQRQAVHGDVVPSVALHIWIGYVTALRLLNTAEYNI